MRLASSFLIGVLSLGSLALVHGKDDEQNDKDNNEYYDDLCTNANTSPRNLTPNTIHKICPETTNQSLGQPKCGDGSDFAFIYTSPTQRKANGQQKIVIEFQGGGACWSEDTCNQNLSYPDSIDNLVGVSCSAASYASGDNFDGYPVNFLCDSTIGDTDLSTYHYILVPYCTQDVHLGDNMAYDDGDDDGFNGIYHHGAHNMMSVLRWVYKHFPNPSHVFLTGCSAGGSVLPVAYDLVYHHYNSFLKGGRTVNVNTIIDSAVYLTPKYFLNNGMPNWNANTILEKTNFHIEQEKTVQYSTDLWNHILKRGSNKDKWGFLSHTSDPVSVKYWQSMGAGYYDDDGDGDGDCDSWYSDMDQSLYSVQGSHKNADTFFIDGNGHCSLGLYYGLQEDGFEEWAGEILREQTILKSTTSNNKAVPFFMTSLAVAAVLFLSGAVWRRKDWDGKGESLLSPPFADTDQDNEAQPPTKSDEVKRDIKKHVNNISQKVAIAVAPFLPMGKRFQACPVTTFYFSMTSLYFVFMLISGGFVHPLNNPSLGPSAVTMSQFGINNPTLIADKKQIFRLLSSGFMCSGLITYAMTANCIFKCMRHTERITNSTFFFGFASACIMLGSNLIYTCFGNGASCGSLGFALGMNAFSIALSKKLNVSSESPESQLQRPVCSTVFFTLLAVTLFPFNSWILIISAIAIGTILPSLILKKSEEDPEVNEWMPKSAESNKVIYAVAALCGFLFFLILIGVPNPNEIYQYPYTTGCSMMYSTDLASLTENFGGRRLSRKLEFDFNDIGCAQFCVPHLVDKPFYFGLKKYADYSGNEYAVDYGLCENIGYDEHIADTTFEYLNYPLDVEVYDAGENNN